MTRLLETALATIRILPPERQDEIARPMLEASGDPAIALAPVPADDLAALEEAEAEDASGDYASDAEVAAARARFHR